MYHVSDLFLRAVQKNTRKYYWTGKITTKAGTEYEFGAEDIVKGSGYITSQCCGFTEIELGTVYAAEMGITLLTDIDRYTLEEATVELFYHLRISTGTDLSELSQSSGDEENEPGNGSGQAEEAEYAWSVEADGIYETIPMGIFEVSEANRTVKCLELKAYDHMLRFERDFDDDKKLPIITIHCLRHTSATLLMDVSQTVFKKTP